MRTSPVIARIDKTGDPWLERDRPEPRRDHRDVPRQLQRRDGTPPQRSLELCRRYGDRAREGDALSVAGIILLEVGLYDHGGGDVRRGARPPRRARLALEPRRLPDLRRRRATSSAAARRPRDARRGARRSAPARRALPRGERADLARRRPPAARRARRRDRPMPPTASRSRAPRRSSATRSRASRATRSRCRALGKAALAEAGDLVHRALALLDQQRYLEGSEEEVYVDVPRGARARRRERSRDDRARARRPRSSASSRR